MQIAHLSSTKPNICLNPLYSKGSEYAGLVSTRETKSEMDTTCMRYIVVLQSVAVLELFAIVNNTLLLLWDESDLSNLGFEKLDGVARLQARYRRFLAISADEDRLKATFLLADKTND